MQASDDGSFEMELLLDRADDDWKLNDPRFQAQLQEFDKSLESAGIEHAQALMLLDAIDAPTIPQAHFYVTVWAAPALGAIGVALGAWISGRAGRKVRLKVGDIEVEARTIEEVELLLQRAQALQASQRETKN
ncbi:hypothetical protein QFZ99_002913 [Paraburkholderia atlantica]|uniref:hypothetical protein n=1 Tax=Paraburkholderia atlantica TaxID=2654982 RepID=UPI003D20E395